MSRYKASPDVQPRSQNKTSTCWLSCLEMMFQWKYQKSGDYDGGKLEFNYTSCQGYDYTSEILWKLDASYSLNPELMYRQGIAMQECRETAKMLGLQATGIKTAEQAEYLFSLIPKIGPLWISGMWIPNRSHAIVITGYNSDNQKVHHINPWQNFTLSESLPGTLDWLLDRGNQWINCDASVMYWR